MSLLWCDGFDHYGLDETNMLDGVYAAAGAGILSTTQVATGTHSYFFNENTFPFANAAESQLRKVLPNSVNALGMTARFYFPSLPATVASTIMAVPTSSTTLMQLSVVVDTNGALRLYRGMTHAGSSSSLGTLIHQSDPLLVASAFNHIEIIIGFSNTVGYYRVAINGIERINETGLDTLHNADPVVSISHFIWGDGATTQESDKFYMDDYIVFDPETGDTAVDTDWNPGTGFIGELQAMYLPPNGDTVEEDWVPSTGTDSFAMVDEVDPNDADYIYSTTATNLTEFDLTDLPEEITYIRGLQLLGRLSKSDAGAAMTKFGMNSSGTIEDAAERPVTVEPTYWWDFMNEDPNSSARWTRASLNLAKFRITRSV